MDPDLSLTCKACGSSKVKLATDAVYVVYLRCQACFNVWSMPKEDYLRIRREKPKPDEDGK
jgi:hypothetical protein